MVFSFAIKNPHFKIPPNRDRVMQRWIRRTSLEVSRQNKVKMVGFTNLFLTSFMQTIWSFCGVVNPLSAKLVPYSLTLTWLFLALL